MMDLNTRTHLLEREADGVVIQLLAPSIEPLTEAERERVFAGAAGLARPLFEEVPDRAAADDRLFARFHGLHWLCARLADERPLAFLVDDSHWADEHSLRFLTRRTVEMHLTGAYRKLGVSGRQDLPAALAASR